MVLTISGLADRMEWRSLVALAFQSELLITGLAGWCPVYWACDISKEIK